jgi:gamma-carbonic anhydrase
MPAVLARQIRCHKHTSLPGNVNPESHAAPSLVEKGVPSTRISHMANLMDQLETFLRRQPVLGRDVYIATGAVVTGDVVLGDSSSIWYNAVVRGDINRIVIGEGTNIQDNAVLHLADAYPCLLGKYVTVGHSAIVHACSVGDECLVGMGAILLDGAEIGNQCLIGARALVTQGMNIPDGSLVLGAPAKIVRALSPPERAELKCWATKYVENAAYCLRHGINVAGPLDTSRRA